PQVGAVLSAAGALMSDLAAQYRRALFASSASFDHESVNEVLGELEAQCQAFADGPGAGAVDQRVEFFAEARYPDQVWEIEVPLAHSRFNGEEDVAELVEAFHRAHEEVFAIRDAGSQIEIMAWVANVRCRLRESAETPLETIASDDAQIPAREVWFAGHGKALADIRRLDGIAVGETLNGPAIIESPFSAIVVDPGASATRRPSGSISIDPGRPPATQVRP
ncbi:MAG: hydantoinase/oxoprolinase family protein, partial [Rhizobiales bacterium]|nr:hydantoinase/oxoprolinase family protein [Hyphomicrobiales bacterium]